MTLGPRNLRILNPEDDRVWNTKATMTICPHPELSDEQADSIKRDFNMVDGVKYVDVRLAMAYYFIMRMNLDLDNFAASASANQASEQR